MPLPKNKHLKHLNKKWIDMFVNWMERIVRNNRIAIYITFLIVLILSIIGIYQIEITGSRIEDLPKSSNFVKDVRFFEEEYIMFSGLCSLGSLPPLFRYFSLAHLNP